MPGPRILVQPDICAALAPRFFQRPSTASLIEPGNRQVAVASRQFGSNFGRPVCRTVVGDDHAPVAPGVLLDKRVQLFEADGEGQLFVEDRYYDIDGCGHTENYAIGAGPAPG